MVSHGILFVTCVPEHNLHARGYDNPLLDWIFCLCVFDSKFVFLVLPHNLIFDPYSCGHGHGGDHGRGRHGRGDGMPEVEIPRATCGNPTLAQLNANMQNM